MTQNTTQKWVENKHMMINHNNKDKAQNNKEPLIEQENDTRK